MALRYYPDLMARKRSLRADTRLIYDLIHEAYNSELTLVEQRTIKDRYMQPIAHTLKDFSKRSGTPERTIKERTSNAVDKIHNYMNGWE